MKRSNSSNSMRFRAFFIFLLLFSMFASFTPAFTQATQENNAASVTNPFGNLQGTVPQTVATPASNNTAGAAASGEGLSGLGQQLSGFFSGLFNSIKQIFAGISSIFGNFMASLSSGTGASFGSVSNIFDLSTSTSSGTSDNPSPGTPVDPSDTPAQNNGTAPAQNNTAAGGSSTSVRVAQCAERYINSTQFRGPEVNGGRLACAQFVSTALKDAGVLTSQILGVPALVTALRSKGYSQVTAPPFQTGDIVTWRTYDRNGDGRKDDDTHVGVMCADGKALSNSSSQRMPRKHDVFYAPICRVLRKA